MTPDPRGRTILITGANTGIGRAAAESLAGDGARLLLACRSGDRGRGVVEAIAGKHGPDRATLVPLDLADFASIRAAAAGVTAATDRLHVLVNNAGVAGHRGLTHDGFELTFGVNHLGHFLLTLLLLPLLRAAGQARIVNVASVAHYRAKGIDYQALRQPRRTFTGLREYNVSKLCNVLFTRELTRRAPDITSVAVHPGTVASDIWRRIPQPFRALGLRFMISSEEGARRVLRCVNEPNLVPGAYYDQFQERRPSRPARDEALAAELWRQSAEWTGADL